jgi:Fe-S-cluster containining protein
MSDWYAGLKIPCPFLSEGVCRIYEQRPLACREYFVTSPPEWCRPGGSNEPNTLPMPFSTLESLGKLIARLEQSDVQAVMLPLALIDSEGFSNLSEKSWPAVKMMNLFLDIIEETAVQNAETLDSM